MKMSFFESERSSDAAVSTALTAMVMYMPAQNEKAMPVRYAGASLERGAKKAAQYIHTDARTDVCSARSTHHRKACMEAVKKSTSGCICVR